MLVIRQVTRHSFNVALIVLVIVKMLCISCTFATGDIRVAESADGGWVGEVRPIIPVPFHAALRRGITMSSAPSSAHNRNSFHPTRACALPSNFRRRRRRHDRPSAHAQCASLGDKVSLNDERMEGILFIGRRLISAASYANNDR